MSMSVDGLVSGLNTTDLINQLMSIEAQSQNRLKQQQADEQSTIKLYQTLNSKLSAVQTAAKALNTPSSWQTMKATSSDTAAVSATAGAGALGGSLSFTVENLATAHSVVSAGTVSSLTSPAMVGTSSYLLSRAAGIGFSRLSGTGLAVGAHTITVSQATVGATVTGSAPLGATTVFGANNTLQYSVDGGATTQTITFDPVKAYTAADVAKEITTQSGGLLNAAVDASGTLSVATVREGSAATLRITGGSALAALSLAVDAGDHLGTNGVVNVDGTNSTITDTQGSVVLASGTGGTVTATFGGGLRAGTVTATNVSTGDGSLTSVVNAINGAGAGISATAVQVGTNAYRLQLASTATGTANALTVDTSVFSAQLGSLNTLTSAADATITVGKGSPNQYSVTSGSNTLTGVLPGVTLTLLQADPSETVTVNVANDATALSNNVQKMVDAINDALGYISEQSQYNTDTNVAGPLLGDSLARQLQSSLLTSVSFLTDVSALASPTGAGITIQADGTIAFDSSKFADAYAKNPADVAALFQQTGKQTTGSGLSFSSATDSTRPGSYAVAISQVATQASYSGTGVVGGTVGATGTISVAVGLLSATYSTTGGETLDSVADGLNAAMGAKSLGLVAK